MTANYKTLSDFEVATAAEAQSLFMDQSVVKVDVEADLASLPTSVKTAYVLNTGILMARDSANAWKPQGGAAAVAETAPANPQVGQLWVKPSEILPVPVRGYLINAAKNVTATTYAACSVDIARSIVLPKAAMCVVTYRADLTSAAVGTTLDIRASWSGATAGDSFTQVGGYMGAMSTAGALRSRDGITFTVVLAAGTTTFGVDAFRSNTTNATTVNATSIQITPVAWADEYTAGVS